MSEQVNTTDAADAGEEPANFNGVELSEEAMVVINASLKNYSERTETLKGVIETVKNYMNLSATEAVKVAKTMVGGIHNEWIATEVENQRKNRKWDLPALVVLIMSARGVDANTAQREAMYRCSGKVLPWYADFRNAHPEWDLPDRSREEVVQPSTPSNPRVVPMSEQEVAASTKTDPAEKAPKAPRKQRTTDAAKAESGEEEGPAIPYVPPPPIPKRDPAAVLRMAQEARDRLAAAGCDVSMYKF